jgi:NADH-quinone oxidoreductase subunit N
MLVVMFSLTGIPPTIGFFGKLAVINSVVDAGMPGLAVFAVLMSLIGAFYYLRVVKLMYFDEPTSVLPIEASFDMRLLLTVNGLLVLFLGIVPGGLLAVCYSSIVRTLST